jgi:hypothetical protein
MDLPVECTHCKVLMTSWSAPGSPVRYYQCPFCNRTFSSYYSEVFQRRAGARMVDHPVSPAPSRGVPAPTPEELRWRQLKSNAARWFARLEAEERRHALAGSRPARLSLRPTRVPVRHG